MSEFELLKKVVTKLSKENIPYMLTGSIVSSLQGVPRSTHDIDIIISIDKTGIQKIIKAFPKENYYFDEKTINDAVSIKGQFNIIDQYEGDKIDFWILTDSEYDKNRFLRKQKVKFSDFSVIVSAPEDTIVQKLYWAKRSGGSKKQFEDALNVFEVQYKNLDIDYMVFWSKKLSIQYSFKKLREKAEITK